MKKKYFLILPLILIIFTAACTGYKPIFNTSRSSRRHRSFGNSPESLLALKYKLSRFSKSRMIVRTVH